MIEKTILIADKGKVLTDGTVYGKTIYLSDGVTADSFSEITYEEYNKIEQQNLGESGVLNNATD